MPAFYVTGMQAVQSYQSCCVCTHTWSRGPRRKCMYDGYRRFSPIGSHLRGRRLRHADVVYEYRDIEIRPPPRLRTDELVRATSGEPFLLYATYSGRVFSITYTDIFARIRAKFYAYTSRKSTYNIPTYNYLVIAYIERIVAAYSCNVYMSKTYVFLQRIVAAQARIRDFQR